MIVIGGHNTLCVCIPMDLHTYLGIQVRCPNNYYQNVSRMMRVNILFDDLNQLARRGQEGSTFYHCTHRLRKFEHHPNIQFWEFQMVEMIIFTLFDTIIYIQTSFLLFTYLMSCLIHHILIHTVGIQISGDLGQTRPTKAISTFQSNNGICETASSQ